MACFCWNTMYRPTTRCHCSFLVAYPESRRKSVDWLPMQRCCIYSIFSMLRAIAPLFCDYAFMRTYLWCMGSCFVGVIPYLWWWVSTLQPDVHPTCAPTWTTSRQNPSQNDHLAFLIVTLFQFLRYIDQTGAVSHRQLVATLILLQLNSK